MIRYRLHIILMLMMAFAALACSKESPAEVDAMVEFGVVAEDLSTKVLNTDTSVSFEGDDVINVLGFLVEDEGDTDYNMPYIGKYTSGNISPLSFKYSEVTADGEVGDRKVYPSGYYWPKFNQSGYESLHFYGYYALQQSENDITYGPFIQYNTDAAPSFIYKADDVDYVASNQFIREDFLVADMTASANDVELQFKHPLAQVVLEVKLIDWIGALDINWMFPDYVIQDEYDCGTWQWKGTSQVKTLREVATTENVVKFFAIPQKITEFAVVWNYHKELVTLPTALELKAGERHKITLTISINKVIGVVTSTNEAQKWDTVENNNNLN